MEYEQDEWVENIQIQTARMSKLISNLVTLSRLDEENPFPEKQEFSLSDAVWEASEPYRNCQSQGKRISALTIRFLIFQKYLNVFTAEILHILHRLAEVESDFPLPGQLWKHMADRSVPAMLMKKSFSGFCFKTKPW